MKIDAGSIYYRRNANSAPSYIIVLGTTKVGMTYTFINSIAKAAYEHIDECKLSISDDGCERYVEFDRLHYMPWSKLYTNHYSFTRKCSFKEMNNISSAIKDFILGNITQDDCGKFYYKDEIPVVKEHSPSINYIINENEIDNTAAAANSTCNTTVEKACNNDTSNPSAESKEDSNTADIDITNPNVEVIGRKSDTTNFGSNNDIAEKAKEYNIPIQEPNKHEHTETKMYDLMDSGVVTKPSDYSSKYPAKKSTKKNIYAAHRMFTEEEAFVICFMNINSISKKYGVSKSRACIMLKNAKTIFGYPVTDRAIKFDYRKMTEMGYSIDRISEITGTPVSTIKRCIECMSINGRNGLDADSCRSKWDKIIRSGDIDKLADAINTKIIDFAKEEMCSISVARDILSKIKEKLYIDPIYAIGFGKHAKDVSSYIESIRSSKRESDQADVIVYDIAVTLKEAYQKSYNDHAEILAGSKPIPDSVKKSYHDSFMAMIYNRLNDTRILAKNRPLTKSQKLVIKDGSVSECKIAFMNVNIKSYKTVKASYTKS